MKITIKHLSSFVSLLEHVLKVFLQLYLLDFKALLEKNNIVLLVRWSAFFVAVLLKPQLPFFYLRILWFAIALLNEVPKIALMHSLPSFELPLDSDIRLSAVIFFIISVSCDRVDCLIHSFIHKCNILIKAILIDTVLFAPISFSCIVESVRKR